MFKTLKDFDFKNKRALIRVDFNVSINEYSDDLIKLKNTPNDFRLKAVIPTINYLIENKAKIILISHLGRPSSFFSFNKERKDGFSASDLSVVSQFSHKNKILEQEFKKYSLSLVAKRLEVLLNKKVRFLDDCIGEKVIKEIEKMKPGEIVLLENLRFYKEEGENNKEFAKEISKLGDIFIQEAFASCHRNDASIF